jgi:nucleoside-diphosphate-sugar epimerase
MNNKMERILVIGAIGQIGSELTLELRKRYGNNNVIASDVRNSPPPAIKENGIFETIDVMDKEALRTIIKKHNIDSIFHLAAILSAVGEKDPQLCWNININGSLNVLNLAVEMKLNRIIIPSSMAAWGKNVEKENVKQDSVLQPTSMYGVTKVAGELLCDYYVSKFGLDCRGLRYPGIISHETLPGGGTTDYAVDIFYSAVKGEKYKCFLSENTMLPMMFMGDCIKATVELAEADFNNLIHHSNFNVAAMSFTPKQLFEEIKKFRPDFEIEYVPDFRQEIADSWVYSIDDSAARKEWNWKPDYDITAMTKRMLEVLTEKHKNGLI